MEPFPVIFGGIMAGLVIGLIAFALSGLAVVGWIAGIAAGLTMSWKLLMEDA